MQVSMETDVPENVTEDAEAAAPPPAVPALIMLESADDAAVCDADGWCA
ncbi:hypothetical protein [Catenuloplanes atrovinosus]|uniref:Uncharacterized protein n=1 Tax=Catenuloplanes atrovinosus TaxID=137266 RepID=A0AAE3YN05_9ACTN|nr:hypothetical protein [Catenuloplanes atrovinosus]MDR7275485.1 hypothetical protein [Catenuloplanes atrovinosus]